MQSEAPGFTEARILSVKAHHINLINHHSTEKTRAACTTVCFDGCTHNHKRISVRVDVTDVRLGVDVTQVHAVWNTNTTHSVLRASFRRGCRCRPIVILGEFSRVKVFFMSWRTVCKLIVVNFWVCTGSIQIYDLNVTFLTSLLTKLQSIQ